MATTVSQLQVTVGADISGALSGLNRINRAVSSAGGFFGRAASTAAGFIGGALGLQAINGVASTASDAIFGFNASLEQSRTSFGVMLGGAAQANDFLGQLQDFAISTPFEFPQLVAASQRMLAFGFASKDVIPLLTDIGNVASASPSGFAQGLDRITLALGQMVAKGRVQGDELLQLQEAGVNTGQIFAIMAQQTGKTVPALQKMQQAGKLLPATFIQAFQTFSQQRFGGLMEAQSHTFTGAVSNIKDALHIGLSQAFAPLFELVKAGAIVLADFLMSPQFKAWVATVQNAVGKVTTVLGAFASEWAALMSAHGVGFFQAGLIALELLIGRTFGPQAQGLFHRFLDLLAVAPAVVQGTLLPAFMQAAAWVQGTLLPVLQQIGTFLVQNIAPILAFVVAFQSVIQVAGIVLSVAAAVTFLLSPIGLLATAAGLLAAAWVGNWGNIQGIVLGFWAVAQPILAELWTWLAANLPPALDAFAAVWASTLLPALQTVAAFTSGTLLPLLGGVMLNDLTALIGMVQAFAFVVTQLLLPGLEGLARFTFGPIIAQVQTLFSWLSKLAPIFTGLGNAIVAAGGAVPDWLKTAATSVAITAAGPGTVAAVAGALPGPATVSGAGTARPVDNSINVTLTGNTISDQLDLDQVAAQVAAAAATAQASAANAAPDNAVTGG